MKKFLKNIILFLLIIILASCGTEEVVKQNIWKVENPIEVVNTTQKNIVSNFIKNSLLRKNVKANIKINIFVNSKTFKQNWDIFIYFKRYDNYLTWNIDLKTKLKWIITADMKANIDFQNIYTGNFYKINKFKIFSKDKRLLVYNRYFSSISDAWIYKKDNNISIYDILDWLKKNNLINVHTELDKYKYNVSLKKDNLVKMMYEIYKQNKILWKKDLNFFKNKYKDYDIKWVLKIESNKKYFSFDGIINEFWRKIPIKFNYLEKSFYLNIDSWKFLLDLKKKQDNFAWNLSLKSDKYGIFKFDVTWKINDKLFKLELNRKNSENILKIFINSNFEKVDRFRLNTPKNFVKFDEIKNYFK